MAEMHQKSLPLILARELAANLATPVFLVDAEGTLVFYNEAAERILGHPFDEAGPLARDEWATMFAPRSVDDHPLAVEDIPIVRALTRHVPSHLQIRITGRDGVERTIAVTAFPLLARAEQLAGAVAIFWEEGGGSAAPGN